MLSGNGFPLFPIGSGRDGQALPGQVTPNSQLAKEASQFNQSSDGQAVDSHQPQGREFLAALLEQLKQVPGEELDQRVTAQEFLDSLKDLSNQLSELQAFLDSLTKVNRPGQSDFNSQLRIESSIDSFEELERQGNASLNLSELYRSLKAISEQLKTSPAFENSEIVNQLDALANRLNLNDSQQELLPNSKTKLEKLNASISGLIENLNKLEQNISSNLNSEHAVIPLAVILSDPKTFEDLTNRPLENGPKQQLGFPYLNSDHSREIIDPGSQQRTESSSVKSLAAMEHRTLSNQIVASEDQNSNPSNLSLTDLDNENVHPQVQLNSEPFAKGELQLDSKLVGQSLENQNLKISSESNGSLSTREPVLQMTSTQSSGGGLSDQRQDTSQNLNLLDMISTNGEGEENGLEGEEGLQDRLMRSLQDSQFKDQVKDQMRKQLDHDQILRSKLSMHPNDPNFSKAIGQRLQMMIGRNLHQAFIQLDPPELGVIDIQLQVQKDSAQVQFQSSQPMVRDALESQMHKLKEMLEQQGLELADGQVSDQRGEQSRQDGENHLRDQLDGEQGEAGVTEQNPRIVTSDSMVDYYA